MPPRKKREQKEIEALKSRRKKAQDRNDIVEEAKICNAIGDVYMRKGDYRHALHYHQAELALSEGSGEKLDAGIAHRRVGECLCELGDYDHAIEHQMKHLEIAKEIGDLAEEQRALATLGRTYFVHSLAEDVGEEEARELRIHAGDANLKSLDVCDKLSGVVADRELLEMRSRLYLNLGLVYQNNGDLHSARKFMEKALGIVRELGDSDTVLQCHLDLGSLYLQELRPALALCCFREALGVANEQRSWQQEAEVYREMSQAQLLMSNFHEAKSCLKKVVRLLQENSQLAETETDQRKLSIVRKVLHYSLEMEALGVEKADEKMKMCEKLGDLCCSIKAFPAATKFYKQQLTLAEAHGVEPKDLSPIYISLACTHCDCCQYSEALLYYKRELELKRGIPHEACDTWSSIAAVRKSAGMESQAVMEAYHEAYKYAKESDDPKLQISVCEAVVQFYKSKSDRNSELEKWEVELNGILEQYPGITLDSSGDESDSQNVEPDCGFETPESLSEMETDEEELVEENRTLTVQSSEARGVAVRRKPKIFKRNEKGETLLHVAAISGNLAATKQLINEGADVNARDNCGWLPLHEACNHGHTDIVSYLLDNGANVNDPGGAHCGGVSPLIDAASSGHMDIVQLLVQRGADVFLKDTKGNMAVDVLSERLASMAESYELEDEHTAIREYLRGEMKKKGWTGETGEDATVVKEAEKCSRNLSSARDSSYNSDLVRSKKQKVYPKGRGTDRTGMDVLLSSDEDDSPPVRTRHAPIKNKEDDKRPSTTTAFTSSLELGRTERNIVHSASGSKQMKRSLDQADMPALISEEHEDTQMITGAFPIIDHWLEDDVGQPLPKKRKDKDPFSTPTEASSSKGMLNLKKGRSINKGKSKDRFTQSYMYGSTGRGGSLLPVAVGEWNNGDDVCELTSVDLPPDVSSHQPPNITHNPAITLQLTNPHQATTTSAPLPLRIRVKIDQKSYLVPCPAKLPDGAESTIQWLAQQAAERYYTQHGVRPHLSLTTTDGALLSGDDIIAHVLQSGEEVIGVAEQWHLPPLPERYQTACSNSGLACHRKVLRLFQDSPSASVLELSHLSLHSVHLPPLLTSLQGQSVLTCLSLSGNRLNVDVMSLLTNALSRNPNLHILDLSCTGITAQCIESLCNPSSSSTSCYHTSPHSTPWSALRELHLGYNPLGPGCGPALSTLLSLTPGLLRLQLQSCGLEQRTLERCAGLGHTLKGLSNLTDFVASLNPLQSSGLITLLRALPTSHLSYLDLANTCTTHQSLTGALEQPKVVDFFVQVSSRLEFLSLSHCPLDVQALCNLLQSCTHLQELRLAAVGITAESLQPLCRLLEGCLCLKLLDVSGNEGMGNQGCLELLTCCAIKTDIKVKLGSCGIRSPLPNELIKTLAAMAANHRVVIVGNAIDEADHKHIIPCH